MKKLCYWCTAYIPKQKIFRDELNYIYDIKRCVWNRILSEEAEISADDFYCESTWTRGNFQITSQTSKSEKFLLVYEGTR